MSPTAIAVAGLVLSAVGTFQQFQEGKKADKRAKESNRLRREAEKKDKQLADLRTLREKRKAIQTAQQQKAEVTSAATFQGAAAPGGSTVPGSTGGIRSQLASNISFLDQANRLGTQAIALLGQSQDVANRPIGGFGSQLASLGGTIFDRSDKLSNIFSKVTS